VCLGKKLILPLIKTRTWQTCRLRFFTGYKQVVARALFSSTCLPFQEQKDSGSEAPAPSAFRDLPVPKNIQNGDMRDVIMGVPSTPEDYEDLRHGLPPLATCPLQLEFHTRRKNLENNALSSLHRLYCNPRPPKTHTLTSRAGSVTIYAKTTVHYSQASSIVPHLCRVKTTGYSSMQSF
jgi:hypothetical protein